jgi:hypothetical protein
MDDFTIVETLQTGRADLQVGHHHAMDDFEIVETFHGPGVHIDRNDRRAGGHRRSGRGVGAGADQAT